MQKNNGNKVNDDADFENANKIFQEGMTKLTSEMNRLLLERRTLFEKAMADMDSALAQTKNEDHARGLAIMKMIWDRARIDNHVMISLLSLVEVSYAYSNVQDEMIHRLTSRLQTTHGDLGSQVIELKKSFSDKWVPILDKMKKMTEEHERQKQAEEQSKQKQEAALKESKLYG